MADIGYVLEGQTRLLNVIADNRPIPTFVEGNPIGELLEAKARSRGYKSVAQWEAGIQVGFYDQPAKMYKARYAFIVDAYRHAEVFSSEPFAGSEAK